MPTFVPAGATQRCDLRPTATQVDRATLRGSPFPLSYRWGTPIIVQMGDALSYKWGMRQPPSESTQLRESSVLVIVCYNYTLCRPLGRYIWTYVHLYFGTSVSPLFPLLSYKWGTPIIVQMGDALSYRWGTLLLCNAEGNKPRGRA